MKSMKEENEVPCIAKADQEAGRFASKPSHRIVLLIKLALRRIFKRHSRLVAALK